MLAADAFVAEVRTVGSASMAPALAPGERVLVAKAGTDRWALTPGTIVVFDAADLWAAPGDPAGTVFVKRVVGVGGDRMTCCRDGQLLRNGQPLAEPWLAGRATDQVRFDIEVPEGHYWLLGDDRADSADAREHLGDPGGGNVPASRIIGTVEAVVWPPGSVRQVEGSDG
ncbi:MAG: signal peptidase I [Candidatus Nanopelagicales bacterium]|nr:signal peptidase I [Candidatus Nanopelagicales bacterium]